MMRALKNPTLASTAPRLTLAKRDPRDLTESEISMTGLKDAE
jgi:hypothetical protein